MAENGSPLTAEERLWCGYRDPGPLGTAVTDAANALGIDIPGSVTRAAIQWTMYRLSDYRFNLSLAEHTRDLEAWRRTTGYQRACRAAMQRGR